MICQSYHRLLRSSSFRIVMATERLQRNMFCPIYLILVFKWRRWPHFKLSSMSVLCFTWLASNFRVIKYLYFMVPVVNALNTSNLRSLRSCVLDGAHPRLVQGLRCLEPKMKTPLTKCTPHREPYLLRATSTLLIHMETVRRRAPEISGWLRSPFAGLSQSMKHPLNFQFLGW